MALKISTKMRNDLLSGKELRKTFEDAVIQIYSGAAPSTADAVYSGTLLCTISKAAAVVHTADISIAQEALILVGSHASGETFTFIDDGTNYTYTNTPDLDAIPIATAWAKIINDTNPNVDAMSSGTATIYLRAKFKGVAHTWSLAGTGTSNAGTGAHALTDTIANTTNDTIRFGAAVDGVISKASETWSGVAVATGTAGYFRIQNSTDVGAEDSVNKLFPRIQGTVGVSGTEMTLSNTTITSGATQTIDTATITMPAS